MDISAGMVKELRERTNAPMMDCKKALVEAEGDMDRAITILKEKGLAKAAKKAGRIATEGVILINVTGNEGLILELNCETDFVAKNDDFKNLSVQMLDYFVKNGKEEGILVNMQESYYDAQIEKTMTEAVAKIGENIRPRRFMKFKANAESMIHSYLHMGGKIGVLIELVSTKPETFAEAAVKEMVDDVAMQIAAMKPLCVTGDEFPKDVLESEREVYRVQVREQGKPENMIDKIVEGKLKKLISENALISQVFVKNQDQTVEAYIKETGKKFSCEYKVKRFVRFELGEGIEKKKDDFAAEVAAQVSK